MKNYDIFGYTFNGLEFVTYLLIPSSIIIMVLVYLYFNKDLLNAVFGLYDD